MNSIGFMRNTNKIISKVNSQVIFLVWGKPYRGPRSRLMAEKLGIDIQFVYTELPRGIFTVPLRYPVQAIRTMSLLFQRTPKLIFVQNPPFLSVLCVYLYCAISNAKYLIDSHSDAFLPKDWSAPPTWLKCFLARRALITIVTNEHFKQTIESWGGKL